MKNLRNANIASNCVVQKINIHFSSSDFVSPITLAKSSLVANMSLKSFKRSSTCFPVTDSVLLASKNSNTISEIAKERELGQSALKRAATKGLLVPQNSGI